MAKARQNRHRFVSSTSEASANPLRNTSGLACPLHYSKAEGGSHENQDAGEVRTAGGQPQHDRSL